MRKVRRTISDSLSGILERVVVAAFFVAIAANGQTESDLIKMGFVPRWMTDKENAEKAESAKRKYAPIDLHVVPVTNPWRVLAGHTNYIAMVQGDAVKIRSQELAGNNFVLSTNRYVLFESAEVIESLPAGVLVKSPKDNDVSLIKNYPSRVSAGQVVSFVARDLGLYAQPGTVGNRRDVQIYDHGTVVAEPDFMATRRAQSARKAEADNRAVQNNALKFNFESAERGESYGQYRLGMRYLQGDGVAKDLLKAREWLTKAADQGHVQAKEELSKLDK